MEIEPSEKLFEPGDELIDTSTGNIGTFVRYLPEHPEYVAEIRLAGRRCGARPFELNSRFELVGLSDALISLRRLKLRTQLIKGVRWLVEGDVLQASDTVIVAYTDGPDKLFALSESERLLSELRYFPWFPSAILTADILNYEKVPAACALALYGPIVRRNYMAPPAAAKGPLKVAPRRKRKTKDKPENDPASRRFRFD